MEEEERLTKSEWQSRIAKLKRNPRQQVELVCAQCGKNFTAARRTRVYCSAGCNQKAYTARKLAAALGVKPADLTRARGEGE